ncbi:aconitate hydratase [bacterium]|nr:aconitate hydratase [bacterium]
MANTLTQKLFAAHRETGSLTPGEEIALHIGQTLTQDATGTLVMLELEAIGLDRVKTERSVQYVDHNLVQQDYKNADDHLFLRSACERFGVTYSRPGNGVSHPLHMQYFGIPGESLLGSDSHTCAGGALGMLAMGAGGLEVAMAMTGQPYHLLMPKTLGVYLHGSLPPWVSAKDVILEMLRRRGVHGGVGYAIEYRGPGVASLDVWDRHVIANMGAELGATATVFPSDHRTREFLERQGRGKDWLQLAADNGAVYDEEESIDLDTLVPLIAKPSSPGNVVPVEEVAGEPIYQAYIGSSANPGYRDYAVAAAIVNGEQIPGDVSFDINPSTRGILMDITNSGSLAQLVSAGARVHQAGCNGCIGMGQAPASGKNSLRTTPRNFPGRSGTREDAVWLCSPETATVSALHGVITDPREFGATSPTITPPAEPFRTRKLFAEPTADSGHRNVELVKGPNIHSLPGIEPVPDEFECEILLVMGDNVSTDEILPAGTNVLPFRSNIPKIAEFAFSRVDDTYFQRANVLKQKDLRHAVVAGENYGQGSSREHAALAPAYLGLSVVLVRSFARIHQQNLVNFGVLPLLLTDQPAPDIQRGGKLKLSGVHQALDQNNGVPIVSLNGKPLQVEMPLTERERSHLRAGGVINWLRQVT